MKKLCVYTDTSVIGGYFDEEFKEYSQLFIENLKSGLFTMLVSGVVIEEISYAPENVRSLFDSIPAENIEIVPINAEIIELRNAYLDADILSKKWTDDATHVAAATVSRADAIVSWNFKHIVRLDKMKAYNQTNLLNGYGIITIISPREMNYESSE